MPSRLGRRGLSMVPSSQGGGHLLGANRYGSGRDGGSNAGMGGSRCGSVNRSRLTPTRVSRAGRGPEGRAGAGVGTGVGTWTSVAVNDPPARLGHPPAHRARPHQPRTHPGPPGLTRAGDIDPGGGHVPRAGLDQMPTAGPPSHSPPLYQPDRNRLHLPRRRPETALRDQEPPDPGPGGTVMTARCPGVWRCTPHRASLGTQLEPSRSALADL